MKKSLLSALGLSVALCFSMPVLGNAQTSTAPAATTTTTTPAPATTTPAKPHTKDVVAKKKVCKSTKKHKCPVKHRKHTAKAPAKQAY